MNTTEMIESYANLCKPVQFMLNSIEQNAYLSKFPSGYKFFHALCRVHAEILNGGISGLYSNSSWPLTWVATEGAREFQFTNLHKVLIDAIYYYHRSGKSRFKSKIQLETFSEIKPNWAKTLSEIDRDYYGLFEYGGTKTNLQEMMAAILPQFSYMFDLAGYTPPRLDSKLAMVSKKITQDGNEVKLMYREGPKEEDDSGWRFLALTESDKYFEKTSNFSCVKLSVLQVLDPNINRFISSPTLTAFKWNERTKQLEPYPEYKF